MKRKISTLFSKRPGGGRDLGQCVAAAVIALTLTVTGAAGYAAAVFEPQVLLVEPGTVYQEAAPEQAQALPAAPAVAEAAQAEAGAAGEAAQPEAAAQPAETEQAAPAAETPAAEETAAPETAPEQSAPAAEEPAPAGPEAAPALPQTDIEEENGLTEVRAAQAGFQQMTEATAAEDPLAARYEATTITPDASGRITLTPDEFNTMLENQNIDWDEENCLSWFFNWLFNWLFPERETPAYSGWRTEGNKTYYYDPTTHERLTGLQTIDDKIYYFDANGVRQDNVTFGIDVSRYQQKVDWQKVKQAGASFVIIRIGYRGYETGALVLDYPVYFDSEYSTSSHTGRADNLTKAERTACAVAFCEELKKYGYEPGVYASTSWFQNHLDLSALQGYRIWNAHYGVSAPSIDCDMWQGSCTGKLSGVSSSGVDLNISYMG